MPKSKDNEGERRLGCAVTLLAQAMLHNLYDAFKVQNALLKSKLKQRSQHMKGCMEMSKEAYMDRECDCFTANRLENVALIHFKEYILSHATDLIARDAVMD